MIRPPICMVSGRSCTQEKGHIFVNSAPKTMTDLFDTAVCKKNVIIVHYYTAFRVSADPETRYPLVTNLATVSMLRKPFHTMSCFARN